MEFKCKKCGKKYSEAQLKYFSNNNLPVPEYCRDCRKSLAKALGMKSAFDMGDGTSLITSFGKGNEAVCEKKIASDDSVESIQSQPAFGLKKSDSKQAYAVTSGRIKLNDGKTSEFDKPKKGNSMSSVRLNGYHAAIEKKFFDNKSFNDNIHIQIAYNVMDIEKIMAVHINNIIFAINNIMRRADNENNDFIGYQGLTKTYSEYSQDEKKSEDFKNLVSSTRLSYFGSAFTKTQKGKTVTKSDEEIYYIISLLGQARQMLAHGSNDKGKSFIYNIGTYFGESASKAEIQKNINSILDETYEQKLSSLNNGFIKKSKKDIYILLKIINCNDEDEKEKVISDYYDFVVLKKNKNLGFSITKLREIMLEKYRFNGEALPLNKKYDSVRSKIYNKFDYLIYRYYTVLNKVAAENLVNELRASFSEEEKDAIYKNEANGLLEQLKNQMNGVCRLIGTGAGVANIKDYMIVDVLPCKYIFEKYDSRTGEIRKNISTPKNFGVNMDADYFSKFIYLVTLFIDGKEINDLLTTLINKFENIASLVYVLKNRKMDLSLSDSYKMFERSKKIAEELRVINSFARMESPSPDAKRSMFIDAIKILGLNNSENSAIEFYKEHIDPYCYDKEGNIIDVTENKKGRLETKHKKNSNVGIYNFIASNVIESNRFKYLVRYANTEKIRSLAKNKQLVSFVVKKLPNSQIVRYYNACYPQNKISEKSLEQKHIDELINIVTDMNFDKIEGVSNNTRDRNEDIARKKENDKQKKQAIITFYLTILYHITKNLVYVNSRYFMAFHCLERDMNMFGEATRNAFRNEFKDDIEDCVLTRVHITQENAESKRCENDSRSQQRAKSKRRRWCYLLNEDINNLQGAESLRRKYRNAAAHLNIPRNANDYIDGIGEVNSYYEIYHYMMQQYLQKVANDNEKEVMAKFNCPLGQYSKDMVKALNAPFGYNLPRFKSLSVEALFDMNNPIE